MNIAIFGGSFDPPHIGHYKIANEALKSLDIEKLIIVPTYLNPFKKSFFLDEYTRLRLLKKLFNDIKKIYVCDYEISKKDLSYTIDTINYLKNIYNPSKIFLIIGEDNLDKLHLWNSYEEIKELVEFVIATRKEYATNKINNYKKLFVSEEISSTKIRNSCDLSNIPNIIRQDIENLLKTKVNKN